MTFPALALAACAAALLLAATPLHAQEADAGALQAARTQARALLDTSGVPGLSVAVVVRGQVVWAEGFGWANVEDRVPADPATVFGIGSVSKPLVAAALARMAERGDMDLDAPAARYVAGYPAGREAVTLRRLAGHLGGIRHYDMRDFTAPPAPDATPPQRVARFQADPLVAEPGTRHAYSSWGYVLLSAAMEAAAGRPFLALMDDEVMRPLRLGSTSVDVPGAVSPSRAAQYTGCTAAGCTRAPYADYGGMWAAGGFTSTATDLARFGAALLRPGYLRPETVDASWTPQRTSAGEETGYGMGWRIGRDANGHRIVHHGGRTRDLRAFLLVYPDHDVVVAVLANGPADFAEAEAARLAAPFLPASPGN
ncbi:MAG TPA: serine hydrolase domain-containing protein [Longimicrobium sp.]|nr:serine hydrolase domain-containing protein [Longimicrobium sp.]